MCDAIEDIMHGEEYKICPPLKNELLHWYYPERIKNNVHAQAFYGVLSAILDNVPLSFGGVNIGREAREDFIAEIAKEITEIVAKHSQVDWSNNKTIHDRISQDIDDLFYRYECESGVKLPYEIVDKIIENVKTVALRRF